MSNFLRLLWIRFLKATSLLPSEKNFPVPIIFVVTYFGDCMMHHGSRLCVLNVKNNYYNRDTTALHCVFLGLGTLDLCYMKVRDIPCCDHCVYCECFVFFPRMALNLEHDLMELHSQCCLQLHLVFQQMLHSWQPWQVTTLHSPRKRAHSLLEALMEDIHFGRLCC